MFNWKGLISLVLIVFSVQYISAQRIVYSEPDREDSRRLDFEIIGKTGANFLIYKNLRGKNWISVYDNDMNQVRRVEQDYMPNDRLINVDFYSYGDFSYMIYQYQKRNAVYCAAVKLDENGNKTSDVMLLDTSHINFAASNKIYSTISSEDKEKLMVFKINSKNRREYILSTRLYNKDLTLQKASVIAIPMEERNDYLDEFQLDNKGDLVFTKFSRNNNDNINKVAFIIKKAGEDNLDEKPLNLPDMFLDQVHIKIDNFNNRYFLTSFFYKERRGNIDGFYFYTWDQQSGTPLLENTITFSPELRKEAKGESNIKMAFNDYFIRNIITKKDGGFIIGSEAFYTTSRANSWNRWNYLYGNPFLSPLDYYYYNSYPYYNSWSWRNRDNNQSVRSHADNIVILSFDKTGKLQWSNVISKEQFDDEGGDKVSYQLMNTGSELHFLFNNMEKRTQLLNDFTISPGGEINRNPTLKNLDKGYEFMPKYAKQVSGKQMIVPCIYRNYISFAKIEYN